MVVKLIQVSKNKKPIYLQGNEIHVNNSITNTIYYTIFNTRGMKIFENHINNADKQATAINLNHFVTSTGIYLIRVYSGGKSYSLKYFKK